jgi:hypothetical protein
MLEPRQAREKLQKAIEEEFLRIKNANDGRLGKAAGEIGVRRQQLQQWAKGVPAPADALLMAFLKWGVTVELHDERAKQGEPKSWKFSMSGWDGGYKKPIPKPVQLSLFDALQDLEDGDVEVKIRKKSAGRLELGVEIGFKAVKL